VTNYNSPRVKVQQDDRGAELLLVSLLLV